MNKIFCDYVNMKQYIDKATVVAEIERLITELIEEGEDTMLEQGRISALEDVKVFINHTLEVKEVENFIWNNARTTVPEDSTNQIICIKEDGLAVSTIGKIVNGTVKWAYLDDLLNTNSFNAEVKEVDLETELNIWRHNHFHGRRDKEASGEYLKRNSQLDLAKYFFELGLKAKGE